MILGTPAEVDEVIRQIKSTIRLENETQVGLAHTLIKIDRLDVLLLLIEQGEARHAKMTQWYNIVLDHLANQNKINECIEFRKRIESFVGPEMNTMTWNVLVKACYKFVLMT